MSCEGLGTLLESLIKRTEILINEKIRSGSIAKIKRPYYKIEAKNFHFDNDDKVFRWNMKRVILEKEEYVPTGEDLRNIENEITASTSFSSAKEKIISDYHIKANDANNWIRSLVNRAVRTTLRGESTKSADSILLFIQDLNEAPLTVHFTCYLTGIFLELPEVGISASVRIRQLRRDDVEYSYVESPEPVEAFKYVNRIFTPTVLESSLRVKHGNYIHWEESILDTLRLFRVGAIFSIQSMYSWDTIFRSSSPTSISQQAFPILPRYTIKDDEVTGLQSFFNELHPKIYSLYEEKSESPIAIALKRYQDALELMPLNEVNKITTAIMCLEALYLKAREREELTYRLSSRIAKVSSLIGYQALEIKAKISQAYSMRSTFVHGGALPKKDVENASNLLPMILEMCRVSLSLFLLLSPELTKDSLLSLIDDSMISVDSHNKLQKTIGNISSYLNKSQSEYGPIRAIRVTQQVEIV
ncbi:MAG: hypothetical protein HYY22_02045 [Thaumarchaeota archaeon]|nr:hypothetical protein [Nitrososphaerota archaeon]